MRQAHLHGSLPESTVHLCIDMQRLLAPEGPWPTAWIEPVLEPQIRLIAHQPSTTIFTRFIPPRTPDDMPGVWRRYYEKWRHVTREFLDPCLLDLLDPLRGYAPPATIVDKSRYSAFSNGGLLATLRERRTTSLIISGAETDVCVLATVMSAVDLGFRVVVASNAICSSSDAGHDALMTLYSQRFSEQIEIAPTEEILEAWHR